MRIILLEMRKYWRLRFLPLWALTILLLNPIYMTNLRWYVISYAKSPQDQVIQEWAEKYGGRMDANERKDAEAENNRLRAEMNALIAQNDFFTARGVSDVDSFFAVLYNFSGETEEDAADETAFYEFLENEGAGCNHVLIADSLLRTYDGSPYTQQRELDNYRYSLTPKELARYEAVVSSQDFHGVFGGVDIDKQNVLAGFACAAVLSVIPLLAGSCVRERRCRMYGEQWTTITGRKTVFYQLAAALLSTVLLWLVELIGFAGLLHSVGMLAFWNSPVVTFAVRSLIYDTLWFDFTFGGYLLANAGLTLMIMLGLAAIIFTLSYYSEHTISVLLKTLLPAVGYDFAVWAVLRIPFSMKISLLSENFRLRCKGIEIVVCGVLLALGLAVGMLPVIAARRKELL